MRKRRSLFLTGFAALFVICTTAQAVFAEIMFDPQHYRELIDTLRRGRPPRQPGTDDESKHEAKTG